MPVMRLPPSRSAIQPPADATSCGRVIARYANAIGATSTPVLPTALIASATEAMGEAFEAARKELHEGGEPEVRKLIAQRIIAAARRGELDPVRLRMAALSWII